MKHIKLRREFQGQDSWGAFLEEVAYDDETKQLAYRQTEGGNCCYGKWQDWEDEGEALNFVFGPLASSVPLRDLFVHELQQLPDLAEYNEPHEWVSASDSNVNFGGY